MQSANMLLERERARAIPRADDLHCFPDLRVVEEALIISHLTGGEARVEKAFSGVDRPD